MKKVTGIGGVFFKSNDVTKLNEWYGKYLGFQITQWGASMTWGDIDPTNQHPCATAWSTFKSDSNYFDPSTLPYMINYRVHDLKTLIDTLRTDGVTIAGGIDEYEYGKFAWIVDPEGRKIELWEPIDSGFGEPAPPWTEKVTGLAGIFLKSENPQAMKEWYKKHLDVAENFKLIDLPSGKETYITWAVLAADNKMFSETGKPFIYSYRVKDLESLKVELNMNENWILDPEGNKVVLVQRT